MKKIFLVAIALVSLIAFPSYGSKKKGAKKATFECKAQVTDKLRGSGVGNAPIARVAESQARLLAQTDISSKMKQAALNAKNVIFDSLSIKDEGTNSFNKSIHVPECAILDSKVYQLSPKLYKVEICIETAITIDEIKKTLAKDLVDYLYTNYPEINKVERSLVEEMAVNAINFK